MVAKLENFGISPYTLLTAILLVFMGELCYSFIPDAYMEGKMEKFFYILNIILMVFIFGVLSLLQVFSGGI